MVEFEARAYWCIHIFEISILFILVAMLKCLLCVQNKGEFWILHWISSWSNCWVVYLLFYSWFRELVQTFYVFRNRLNIEGPAFWQTMERNIEKTDRNFSRSAWKRYFKFQMYLSMSKSKATNGKYFWSMPLTTGSRKSCAKNSLLTKDISSQGPLPEM